MKRGGEEGGRCPLSLSQSLQILLSHGPLGQERGGRGPFYIFNFLKKIKMKRGPLPLHHPGLCLHARPVLGLSFLPPPPEEGGGLGVWVGKPASFPLFYNEKGGGFVVLLNIGGASLYQCMS
nr:hypothetical protein [Morchella crassipes]